jgi:hypothetical protein
MASADRLLLPVVLRRRVKWGSPEVSLPLLASIGEGGGVKLIPMKDAQGEIDTLHGAFEEMEATERPGLVLTAMALYCQVTLQPDGRLRLPPTMCLHLDAVPSRRVWVGAYADTLMLWSEKHWMARLDKAAGALREAIAAARAL